MPPLFHRIAVLVAIVAIYSEATAADRTWSNPAGGNWGVAANWGGSIPTSLDNAFLNPLAGAYAVTLDSFGSAASLTLNAANASLNQSGSLTVGSAFTLNAGSYNLAAGTATFNGPVTVGTAASFTWSGGTIAGTGTISGVWYASGGDTKTFSGSGIKNAGTLNWFGGTILGSSSTTFTNQPAAAVVFHDDGEAFAIAVAAPGTLVNQGTLRKTGGSATATTVNYAATFQNGGVIDVQTGTLQFASGGTLPSGTTTISGNGMAALAGGVFTVPGGSTFVAQGSGGANLHWTGGTLAGTGTLGGTLIASGPGTKSIDSTALKNGGTMRWVSGTILNTNSSTAFSNLAAGVIDFQDDGEAFGISVAAPGTLVNQGTLRKSGGAATSTEINFATTFADGGVLNVQSGRLHFGSGGTLAQGTTTTTGSGTAALVGGTFTVPSGSVFTASGMNPLQWTGGTLAGSGTLAGVLVAAGGEKAIEGTGLKNSGTLRWTAGRITGSSSTAITNLASGLIDLQNDGTSFAIAVATPGTIINQGTLQKSSGATSTTVEWNVTNSGTVVAMTGTLNLTATNTNTGVITTGPLAAIGGSITSSSGGRVQGPGGSNATYAGTLTFNAGGVLAPGTTTSGSEYGGILLNGPLAMTTGAVFEIHIKGTQPRVEYDQVSVNGAVTLNNANLSATFVNFTPLAGDRTFILVNDGTDAITGTFAGLPNGGTLTVGGFTGRISYTGDFLTQSLTGGNDVVLYNFVPVPEPLAGIGFAAILGLAIRLRRRSRR